MPSPHALRFRLATGIFFLWPAAICPYTLESNPNRDSSLEYRESPRHRKEEQNLAEERFKMECDYLGLKRRQKKKARPLFDEAQQKRDKMVIDLHTGKLVLKDAHAKLKEIDKNYYNNLSAFLNEKQKKRLKKLQKNRTISKKEGIRDRGI